MVRTAGSSRANATRASPSEEPPPQQRRGLIYNYRINPSLDVPPSLRVRVDEVIE
jgi:hypothetical protein